MIEPSAIKYTWLVEIKAYVGVHNPYVLPVNNTEIIWYALPSGIGLEAVGGGYPLGTEISAGYVRLTYSDTGWIGEPTDEDRANVNYEGRVESALSVQSSIQIMPEADKMVSSSYGNIVLNVGDGALDTAQEKYIISRRDVAVYRGERIDTGTRPFSTFTPVFKGLGVGWHGDPLKLNVEVRDGSYRLETPFQTKTYAGTGGVNGGTELSGKPLPILIGTKFNIKPDLVDSAHCVYRVHMKKMSAVLAARDRGGPLTFHADYATYTDLIAATLSQSEYATCLAQGLVRTGALSPFFTVDARGDDVSAVWYENTPVPDSVYRVFHLLFNYAGVSNENIDANVLFSNTDIDLTTQIVAGVPGTLGLYVSSAETPNSVDVINSFAKSVWMYWGLDATNKYFVGRILDPRYGFANPQRQFYFTSSDVRGDEYPTELAPPAQPRYQQRVNYSILQTNQSGTDLLDSVTGDARTLYETGYKTVTSNSGAQTVTIRYPDADNPEPLATPFNDLVDALGFAATLNNLFTISTRLFTLPLNARAMDVRIGDILFFTYPWLMFKNGAYCFVIGKDVNGDDVDLTVYVGGI